MNEKLNYFTEWTKLSGIFRWFVILFVCLFSIPAICAGMSVQANDTIPQGLWKVMEVTVEKNTDGKVEKNVYATVAEVKSPIPYPQEWYVMHVPQGILLRYADGSENLYRYDIEDNRLIISIDENTTQSYRYEVNGEELILTPVYEKSEKNVEHEGEHQIIILKKQGYNIKN